MHGTRGINFETLSLCDALDLAILIEEEARDCYSELADQLLIHHTGGAATFFRKMALIEEMHHAQLAKRRKELFGNMPVKVTRAMISNVEGPASDEAHMFMTVHDALDTALRCEVKAHAFFDAALPHMTNRDARALFAELRDEEVEHQSLVRRQMERTPGGPGPAGDELDDDPVAK